MNQCAVVMLIDAEKGEELVSESTEDRTCAKAAPPPKNTQGYARNPSAPRLGLQPGASGRTARAPVRVSERAYIDEFALSS
jgi:hypothetical protein